MEFTATVTVRFKIGKKSIAKLMEKELGYERFEYDDEDVAEALFTESESNLFDMAEETERDVEVEEV